MWSYFLGIVDLKGSSSVVAGWLAWPVGRGALTVYQRGGASPPLLEFQRQKTRMPLYF
jgi:hypothetical protein